jgi:hypothetical protein
MSDKSNTTPLAKHDKLTDLPGRFGKSIEVPPGRQGVVIKDGVPETYPSGRHQITSPLEWARGVGSGLTVGYVPGEPFTVRVKAENLLSADRELMDASLLCEVEIVDAARFFTQVVLPQGEISGENLDLPSEGAFEALGTLTRQYASGDLVRGVAIENMLSQIRLQLEAVFNGHGLYLDYVLLISFWRSSDRALAAEKALLVQDRLRDVELQNRMAEVESDIQFQDFVNQLEPELTEKVGLHPVVETAPEDEDSEKGTTILDSFRTWIKFESNKDETGRHFRIDGLFKRLGKDSPLPALGRRRRAGRWWLPRVLWMGFVVFIAFVLTMIVNWIAGSANWGDRWQFYLGVWGFAAIAILESLRTLFQKREEMESQRWTEAGYTFVDDLVGNDRLQADKLVRNQCQREVENAQAVLNDLRSRVYKRGEEDTALQIRSLEKKLGRVREEVLNPRVGQPPYMTDLKINRKLWLEMLDYDEQILVRASALGADAQELQQKYAQGQFDVHHLEQLEGRLDAFLHYFKSRSQAPRISAGETDQYRIKN